MNFYINNKNDSTYIMQTIGIIMVLNHLLYFFIFDYNSPEIIHKIILRSMACILCIPLLSNSFYSTPLNFYKKLYWYVVLLYCLPFFFTFMTLLNHTSAVWLMNCVSAAFFLILLVNIRVAFLILLLGSSLAVFLFIYVLSYRVTISTGYITLYDITATYFAVIIIGGLFAYKKENYENMKDHISQNIRSLNELLEQKVQERTRELEQALAAKTEFLNNMSHEIRTPIQGFTTISEGLVEHWREFSDIRKFELATQVSNNASRLSSLLSHLLDLAKFNAGKMLLDLKPCNLNELIAEITLECKELYLNGKQLDIQLKRIDIPPIMLDFECMGQVLRNLLINAIKFSPNNSVISIDLKTTEISYDNGTQTKALHFTIKDQGVGIPADELNSIFAPFTQSTRTKTKAGGTGLGLAIVKEIIEAHHGKIWAENNLDQGSSFHFIIPVHQSELLDNHQIIAEEVSKINQETEEEITLPKTILMIDNEEACLISMELLLHNSSYQLVKAISGEEGLKYLKNNPKSIDLILLDLMIPDMYGLNILTEIKQDSALASIPVILQSGTSDSEGIKKAYELGIISYIKKPYQKQIIFTELNKAFM